MLLWVVLLIPYIALAFIWNYYNRQMIQIENASFMLISKEELTLSVIDFKGNILEKYPISCGKNMGNKVEKGDLKTPEGVFRVIDIQNATDWTHDFGDGNGKIKGVYGNYFIRLLTPGHAGIGIHGTHDSNSIGTRDSEGCIRLKNEDLEKLKQRIHIGDVVVITPSQYDVEESR